MRIWRYNLRLGSPKQEQGLQQVLLSTFTVNLSAKQPASVDLLFCVFVVSGNSMSNTPRPQLKATDRLCPNYIFLKCSLLFKFCLEGIMGGQKAVEKKWKPMFLGVEDNTSIFQIF